MAAFLWMKGSAIPAGLIELLNQLPGFGQHLSLTFSYS
jgi:hypothetical protein